MRGVLLATLFALAAPGAAWAVRVVDYTIPEPTWNAWAAEQGTPLAPLPPKSTHHVALDIASGVDHEEVRAGIYCGYWHVQNGIGKLIGDLVARWDRDGAPAAPGAAADLTLTVTRAATFSRCIGTGELKGACLTRVSLDATLAGGTAPARPLHVSVERGAKAIGACAGLTRGVALVSREAVVALLTKVDAEPSP